MTDVALAGLAHDIRTPLTGILALAELLHASDLPEREQRWAEAIRGAADHLARLTTLVVDAAKDDASGLALAAASCSRRSDLSRSVAGLLAARAESKGLEVAADIAGDLPARVSGDEVRLRSALENLIDNAVKFTERGRIGFAVIVAPAPDAGRTRLTFAVTDSGIGIERRRAQAAVPSVRAGERRHRAALRRRGSRPGFRRADRRGDGRRTHGHQQAGTRQHVPPDGDGAKRKGPGAPNADAGAPAVLRCACFASRTILMAASC